MACGGWVAGKISGYGQRKKRIMQGFLAWSLATLITVFVTTTAAGAVIGGPINSVRNSISRLTSNAANTSEANVKEAAESLGACSIAMFLAFLLSAAASIGAAACAKPEETFENPSTDEAQI